ncbi:amidohydrolase [Nocardia sp. CDC153]|uniref:amidohydrolase n=1 Tax=Nocardia sp. CDC153 TaxID=3112167 RepID=UPI002DB62645|nr:amidohydrolase [Nocardia sp. CDC153]MEC3956770.1 amidohydrolase [Nocardia sp. CDC153]
MTEHWQQVYRQLHAHPELSGQEHATASLAAAELRAMPGWEVTENVGGTGVVGVLRNGPGPVVWLRADMDALPVQEETGLEYASTVPGVMHACGHDIHVTALLGVCAELAAQPLPGTVVALFQPAEETGSGAQGMINDGLLDRFPHPGIVLGQHVSPLPAGIILSKPGTLMAASDSIRVTFLGKGGHASQPHTAIDPLLMAASLVVRLQSLAARQTATAATPVLTAGALHAGTRPNIIADTSEVLLSLRTFTDGSRNRMIEGIARMAEAEAAAAGAPQDPKVEFYDHFPVTENTPGDTERVLAALTDAGLPVMPMDNPVTGSEDFGAFGTAAKAPSVFWHIGGIDPARFTEEDQLHMLTEGALPERFPSNHSPHFAPDPVQALPAAITTMLTAARAELTRPTMTE